MFHVLSLPLCTNFFIGFCNCSEFEDTKGVLFCVFPFIIYRLCAACENHHKISRGTRYHGIISIENYKKLPSCISEIGHHCKDHDTKYTNFVLPGREISVVVVEFPTDFVPGFLLRCRYCI
jgi:hypothetical protein